MPPQPHVVTTVAELRESLRDHQLSQRRIGLVPTMGALHEGHLSLVRAARESCDVTIATIFVNPTQFAPNEDLAKYPRTFENDLNLLAHERVDLVFAPRDKEMYPPGFSTFVEPPEAALPLEGRFRPGHFRGVATVVLKLFNLVQPTVAFFGQKDYQQCLVVRHMVADLNLPIEIRVCPIVRETDGLAMSSRNRHLSPSERRQATAISRSLMHGARLVENGERSPATVLAQMLRMLTDAGIARIDYVAMVDTETLTEVDTISPPVALLVAAFVGETRLIDNWVIE